MAVLHLLLDEDGALLEPVFIALENLEFLHDNCVVSVELLVLLSKDTVSFLDHDFFQAHCLLVVVNFKLVVLC